MENKLAEPSIATQHLSVEFFGRMVLADINLSILPGELVVIVGPSGSGKSTLLRAINRLNELFPGCRTEGAVRIGFEDGCPDVYANDSIQLPELRRRVGMVFQTPTMLPFSIMKNIAMPLKVTLGLRGADLAKRVQWALRQVALWDEVSERLDHDAATLSGGQQQRLCLARALALEPRVLLMDEPTASLDFRATEKIEHLLLRLKGRYTLVAVSHSLSQARRLADRLIVLREGRAVQQMSRQQLQDPMVFQELIDRAF